MLGGRLATAEGAAAVAENEGRKKRASRRAADSGAEGEFIGRNFSGWEFFGDLGLVGPIEQFLAENFFGGQIELVVFGLDVGVLR